MEAALTPGTPGWEAIQVLLIGCTIVGGFVSYFVLKDRSDAKLLQISNLEHRIIALEKAQEDTDLHYEQLHGCVEKMRNQLTELSTTMQHFQKRQDECYKMLQELAKK